MINSFDIATIGLYVSKKLEEKKVTKNNTLVLTISKEELKKLDEDLYYRQNPNGTDFVPSEKEISLNFENLKVIIRAEND